MTEEAVGRSTIEDTEGTEIVGTVIGLANTTVTVTTAPETNLVIMSGAMSVVSTVATTEATVIGAGAAVGAVRGAEYLILKFNQSVCV